MKLVLVTAAILLSGCVKSSDIRTPAHVDTPDEIEIEIEITNPKLIAAAEWEVISSKSVTPICTEDDLQ